MQKPFPELTDLVLWSFDITSPVVPDSFPGRFAPRLRTLSLHHIPFPGLPKLLLSATHLVELYLCNIPHSGYISPETMANVLSALTSLGSLHLQFDSSLSRPDQPPPKRSSLPVLTELRFKGVSEYFEDLVSRINVPQLSTLYITLFEQIEFNTLQLVQFVSCTPMLKELKTASLVFGQSASVSLSSQTSDRGLVPIVAPAERPYRPDRQGQIGVPGIRGLRRDVRPAAEGHRGLHRAPAGRRRAGRHDHGRRGGHGAVDCEVARAARRVESECVFDGLRAGPHERGAAERARGQRERVCTREPEAKDGDYRGVSILWGGRGHDRRRG
jgi:hypothetical protein